MTHNNIPNVDDQTPLENGPIKIKWQGKDRNRVRRGLRAAAEDGHERGTALPVVTRQKTQVVIKTEEELNEFSKEVMLKAKGYVSKRIRTDINRQLNGNNTTENNNESEPTSVKQRREETDMDTLLNDVVIPHARQTANDVWPGGTVDVDEIKFFWNNHLTTCAGRAYHGTAIPRTYVEDDYRLAIALAPEYYYQHGVDELLEVVRHELIHIWQYEHEMGCGGHGKDFKQWLGDADTHRHCKHW